MSSQATRGTKPADPNVEKHINKLTEKIQAGHFLAEFATWQIELHERLRTVVTVESTLDALQVWADYHYSDVRRHCVVCYVMKQLRRCKKEVLAFDTSALRDWFTLICRDADSAADTLLEVRQ